VCRRWRSVVFQSPRRLNLRLLCTPKTPARDTLDIWPPLPLIIRDSYASSMTNHQVWITSSLHSSTTIACVKSNSDILQVHNLGYVTNSAAMLKPFPELTDLRLSMFVDDGPAPILPDSFLGGTAPRLRSLYLDNVPFPGLPKLLLSATHLVDL
jgi:hypothetical protein